MLEVSKQPRDAGEDLWVASDVPDVLAPADHIRLASTWHLINRAALTQVVVQLIGCLTPLPRWIHGVRERIAAIYLCHVCVLSVR
jgi:hypothetical protein